MAAVGVGRGDVGRGHARVGSGEAAVRRRAHGAGDLALWKHAVDHGGSGSVVCLLTTPRVGVVVYSRVTSEFVGAAEALGAAGELAGVRLLAGVRADVSGLVLKAVECLVAEGTFVGTW